MNTKCDSTIVAAKQVSLPAVELSGKWYMYSEVSTLSLVFKANVLWKNMHTKFLHKTN